MALPEDRLIPIEKFPEAARRFVSPDAPVRLKEMLSKGLVPMKPVVQLCSLYQLAMAETGPLQDEAQKTVLNMPEANLKQVIKQPMLPRVLDWLTTLFTSDKSVIRTILLNPVTDDETVLRVADGADESICDLIAQNQMRLLRCPALIEALYFNPAARASTVDRMLDFAARNQLQLSAIPDYEAIVAEIGGQIPQTEAEQAAADALFRDAQDAMRELSGDGSEDAIDAAVDVMQQSIRSANDFDDRAEQDEEEERKMSAAGRIRQLNVAQKVRLALMGNSAERGILIRDTNKVVARTVIRSPAVTDSEVLAYAKNKSLIDEVISYIAGNRKWTRHYAVKLNLVKNPKTPTSEAMRFLTHLRLSDLRLVAKSRDVPGPISKAAKNMIKARMQ